MFTDERVLIAQASETLRRTLYSSLLRRDIFSDSVSDGAAAIASLAEKPYGVVLLDLSLPPVCAADVLDSLRNIPRDRRPVVIGMLYSDEVQPAIDIETVQIVLRKPFKASQIAEIVDSCLRSISTGLRRIPGGDSDSTHSARPNRR